MDWAEEMDRDMDEHPPTAECSEPGEHPCVLKLEKHRDSVRIASGQHGPAGVSAPDATRRDIALPSLGEESTTMPLSATTSETQTSTSSGPGPGSAEPGESLQSSRPSEQPSARSTRRWRSPRNAMEFAAQANAVATLLLNGEIDVETTRAYSAVARTVAQAMSTEVSRARFVAIEPTLSLSDDVFEHDSPKEES